MTASRKKRHSLLTTTAKLTLTLALPQTEEKQVLINQIARSAYAYVFYVCQRVPVRMSNEDSSSSFPLDEMFENLPQAKKTTFRFQMHQKLVACHTCCSFVATIS